MRESVRALTTTAVAVASALVVSSCGGGGHGGGIGGTGVVFGAISGFGSVIVDGTEFDTSAASISVNADAATEADLALGMVVRIHGEWDDDTSFGVADSVDAVILVEGPVDAVADDPTALFVLGNEVRFDRDTVLEGVTVDASLAGRVVEVSGFVDAQGAVRASRVAARSVPADGSLRVAGIVSNLDTVAETFEIRRLRVDYSQALLDGPASGAITDGLEALVVLASAPIAGGAVAERVALFERAVADALDRVARIEGVVTRRLSERRFVLNNRSEFRLTDRTEFIDGDPAGIVVDAKITVAGILDSEGVISALRISIFPNALMSTDQTPSRH